MTEKEKMLAGELYDACDRDLLVELNDVKVKCQRYNNLLPTDFAARKAMLPEVLSPVTSLPLPSPSAILPN